MNSKVIKRDNKKRALKKALHIQLYLKLNSN